MRYDRARAQVCDLIVAPKPFFTPEVIERRKPTHPKGRANSWVGCNILLGEVPEAGEVAVIREGVALPRTEVIARFRETLFLRAAGAGARGWMIEVLKRVERIGADAFSLDDMYAFEGRLAAIYPGNANVGGRRAGGGCRCCGRRGWSCSRGGGGIGWRGGIRAPAARGGSADAGWVCRRARAHQGTLRSSLRSPLTRPARGGVRVGSGRGASLQMISTWPAAASNTGLGLSGGGGG